MPEPSPALSEAQLVASICRESFFEFVKEFWDLVIPDAPILNWHIEYLCAECQRVAERVIANQPKEYDLVINISPGSTKSTIVSIMLPAWIWTRMKHCRTISASYEHNLALNFSRKSRNIIEHPRYQAAFGPIVLRDDQNTKGLYENTEGGDRKAVGTGGNITGSHGHIIIVDDPINPKKAQEAALDEINTWMDETLPTRKVNKETTPTILIMQRLHQNDPTGHLLAKQKGNIKHINIPGELLPGDLPTPARLVKYYKDGLFDVVRMGRAVLAELRKDLGEYGYAGQILQRPVPAAGGSFKVDNFIIDTPPTLNRFRRIVRYWDKAGTGGGGCFTVGVLMGIDEDGRYWVLDVVRGQWESHARERTIAQTAAIDGHGIKIGVEQEGGSGGLESAQGTVSRLAGYCVILDRPVGDKILRADPYATQVNGGNVGLKKGAPWVKDYVEELRFFPKSTYKDQVDASSGAFAMLANTVRLGAAE